MAHLAGASPVDDVSEELQQNCMTAWATQNGEQKKSEACR